MLAEKKVLVVFGTRPEAIKMAPVVRAIAATPGLSSWVVASGQHREMLTSALEPFGLVPDADLDVMSPGQSLPELTSRILRGIHEEIQRCAPALVLVHGDTTTAYAAALAAFYARVPVGHVEAGLRTGDMMAPWPEEMNRRQIASLATLHFAPTPDARANLIREGIAANRIHVTGNTVIDALLQTAERLEREPGLRERAAAGIDFLDPSRRTVLVTGHRRENFGPGLARICDALARLSQRGDLQLVYPVHLNPDVREPVQERLSAHPNIHLIEPMGYVPFVHLMQRADVILTDSGGLQEEAPALGKPVLVMRETTERPEAIAAGTAFLVGTSVERIVEAVERLLDDPTHCNAMSEATNPYGDGTAAEAIARISRDWLGTR